MYTVTLYSVVRHWKSVGSRRYNVSLYTNLLCGVHKGFGHTMAR